MKNQNTVDIAGKQVDGMKRPREPPTGGDRMQVKNSSDLKIAYEILNVYKGITECEKPEKLKERIAEQKREIRRFHKKTSDRRIVKDYGIDGYVLLIELPETLENLQDAEEYFEECETISAAPSMFDCTGQAFTSWFKVFRRRGRFFAYHSIGFDV